MNDNVRITTKEISEASEGALVRLDSVLRESGYNQDFVVNELGAKDRLDLYTNIGRHALFAVHDMKTGPNTVLGILLQLFMCNGSVPISSYAETIPCNLDEILQELDLVRIDDMVVTARAAISPVGDNYFLSDQLFTITSEGEIVFSRLFDNVMPPRASTFSLLSHAGRLTGGHLLDVGCGSGILGILLAKRHRLVTALDLNERSIAFTRANAVMNASSLEISHGDIMNNLPEIEPVDRLIFNSASAPSFFRGSELGNHPPEELLSQVAHQLPVILTRGGTAQVQLIIEVPQGVDTPTEVVTAWLSTAKSIRIARVDTLRDSPFTVSRASLISGRIDAHSQFLFQPSDSEKIIDYSRRASVAEIAHCVVTLTRI